MRRGLLVLGVVLAVVVAPSASAKDFGPGDLRVCNATRCVPIVSPEIVPLLGPFYYSGPAPALRYTVASVRRLRFRNGDLRDPA